MAGFFPNHSNWKTMDAIFKGPKKNTNNQKKKKQKKTLMNLLFDIQCRTPSKMKARD
jgi:hypothetical protein